MASMMRASSPPEAILWMGRSSSPTLADIRNRTWSMPFSARACSVKQMAKRILPMSSCRSSVRICSSSRWAA